MIGFRFSNYTAPNQTPFADIGYDGIMTIGTELNLQKIYRKPKGRYNLRTKKTET